MTSPKRPMTSLLFLSPLSPCPFAWLQEPDLLQMERTVLNSLAFRVNTPTAYTFWSVYRLGHAMHNPTASLASYLMVRRPAPPGRSCLR